ncbi:MAG: type II toxin-antitoxin system Phd/YefM family antitoxin [Oscillospiraceae bacterium]|nr:type II toxin-antitoxin system Phd/YefM family antitoxin [Oscillospiraceae bacterium]
MLNTHVRPVRDLRNNYPELANIVKENDHIIITNNGKSESVLISMDSFKKYEEFLHYRYIDEKLAEAETQANNPNTKWHSHEEVWGELRSKYGL